MSTSFLGTCGKLLLAAGLAAGLVQPVAAQLPTTKLRQIRAAASAVAVGATPVVATPAATAPTARLDNQLRQLYTQYAAATSQRTSSPAALPATLQAAHTTLTVSAADASGPAAAPLVLVRVTASDVAALLPSLKSRGFRVVSSYPDLHFVEGMLPVSQLATDGQGATALVPQGLLGILSVHRPVTHVGSVTSQADYALEAARTRATAPKNLTGAGVRIGVLSDSYNAQQTAAAGVASGDLPAEGVQVLSEGGGTDEGRAMCELIHDLAPGSPLAFSTANGGQGIFAQHILDLANPTKGNCKVIVDDIAYGDEPFFQDGVIAYYVNYVVSHYGVSYFSAAGNNGDQSYENTAPQFVTDATTRKRLLNFDVTGASTSTYQTVTIPVPSSSDDGTFSPVLQWSDPFYTSRGVKSNIDLYLVAVKNGVVGDTVASSTLNNIAAAEPVESLQFTNDAKYGTTSFRLLIVLRSGAVPTRLKYIVNNNGLPARVASGPGTNSSTLFGHAAAASALAVAAVPFYDQRTVEPYSSKGGTLTFLFNSNGGALATPATRQKPDLASIDGTDTSFFGYDLDNNGFLNFSGTSAAAPHAAAVAALLRASEPALTTTQVASRLRNSARVLNNSATDPLTGAGLIDAYAAVYGSPVATAPPYVEDLEKATLPLNWTVNSTRAGRTQVLNTLNPASGKYHLVLDAAIRFSAAGATQSLNEATCYLTSVPATGVQLTFRERKFSSETDDAMPTSFSNSTNADGVALSVDGGSTWYRLIDLTGTNATTTYQTKTVNLTQFAAANNLTLGSDVRVRFQQYGPGNYRTGVYGRAFDDIAFTALSTVPVPLYSLSQPTTGCPGLQVQYADTSLFKATAYQWTFPGGTPATSTLRNPLVTYNTPGHYGVTLSVSNASGTVARTDTGVVYIYGRAPQVTLTASTTSICRGSTVTFSSSALYCPSSYAWSFPGGSPASSTAQNPGAVTYAAAGSYTATLTVSNAYGSTSSSVLIDVDGRTVPFAENFDNSLSLPRGWTVAPIGAKPWVVADSVVSRSGAYSHALVSELSQDVEDGYYDVYTPALNLSGVTVPKLRFDLAYGALAATAGGQPIGIDSLLIRVADACTGTVLGRVYAKSTLAGLPTTASVDDYFYPSLGSDWRQELVDLTPYVGKSIVLRFINYKNFLGNNLYIDNVQVGSNLLSLTSAASAVGFEAWPVPAPGGSSLNVRLPAYAGALELRLLDAVGRVVWHEQLTQSGAALEHTLPLPAAAGAYTLLYQPATGPAAARKLLVQ